ncbi:AraC family transcriptional regulator CmrA [Roseateles chitinivorans]|uniref:AraC family transcriptional regulator CmrA n=1 Tax=Roseateles chitinivorans TaxID=2917965 RepID=A0A2G9CDW0_9BURK|nr:AraC family transcriptional regulator [Roseateles chitinivorans]PIM54565.1 AraC family transcriptional regulator CmrA [Roseateles chitinivorans]
MDTTHAGTDAAMAATGAIADLGAMLRRHAPREGLWPTALPRVWAIRLDAPGGELAHAVQPASLCVIAQGAKEVRLGDERYVYDAARFMVFTTDLPVSGRVIDATPERPYLCLRLDFDPEEVAELVARSGPPRGPAAAPGASFRAAAEPVSATGRGAEDTGRGLFVSAVTPDMLDAAGRLVRLLDHPEDHAALAPMAMRELVYRVLRSEQGERLAQVARADSQTQRVHRAIRWLKANYAQPLRIEALAREAHMSASSLHHHFRALTSMSPLQYQKQLRLQEARRLLIAEGLEVARAGHAVGYESPSQFSREYSRLYGSPPSRDAARRRDTPPARALA